MSPAISKANSKLRIVAMDLPENEAFFDEFIPPELNSPMRYQRQDSQACSVGKTLCCMEGVLHD